MYIFDAEIVVPLTYNSRAVGLVRIDHEGIFSSRDSFSCKWAEMKELSLATFMGVPYLRIVPWDLAEVFGRAKVSAGPLTRFGINLTFLLFGRSGSPAPIGISQMALSFPIEELLMAIEDHFENEIRDYRIAVRGWQKETKSGR